MKNLLLIILLTLSGCSIFSVHHMDIEQGNVITPEMVNNLRTGMTVDDVKNVMGTPVLMNTFTNHRIDYVYTIQPGNRTRTEKYLTLIFYNGKLTSIQGNMYSTFVK